MIDRKIFDEMFEKIPMGVFILDNEGYFKFVNPMACELTGYSVNELIGMNRSDLLPDKVKEDAENVFDSLKDGVSSRYKLYYQKKSGEIRKWGIKTIRISDEINVAITEDITEYENLVAENTKYLNRLKLAGEAGKVGSWEFDVKSGIFWRSEEAMRQFTGQSIEASCTLEDIDKYLVKKGSLKKSIDLMLKTGKNANKEFEICAEDGLRKTLKTYGHIVKENDEIIKIIGATVDITELKQVQTQITEDKNRFQEYLDIAEVIMLVIDNNGFVKMINRKGCEVLGYDEIDIVGKSWVDNFIPIYLKDKIAKVHSDNLFDELIVNQEVENPVITKDGSSKLIHWKNTIIKDSEGVVIGSLSSGEDVTEKRLIEKALAQSEASLKKAEIITKSGHFEKDFTTNVNNWSNGMYIMLGYDSKSFEINEDREKELFTPKALRKLEAAYHTAIRGNKEFEIEVEAITKGKEIITILIIGLIETDGKKPVKVLASCQNITGRKAHVDHIEYISYHDQLTGLYNRRFLEEEFNRLDVPRNYPFAVIMADVNGLKLANDTFGHAEGDQMLINTAEVLKQAVRSDDIIARVGGDEFMILLPKIEQPHINKILGRILEFSKGFQTTMLPLSVALGSSVKENKDLSRDEVFKKAEDNMYKNKLHEVSSRRSEAIKIISDTLYEKNKREEEHSERVSNISVLIGSAAGMSRPELNELKTLGLMHDIGKIAVKEELLNKPSALTEEEYENIKKHPEAGFRILSTSNDMADLADYVLAHHERWDGKGYPRGLEGEEIPYLSRIISIAEAYDAMTSKNPYRKPLAPRKAYLEIRKYSGSQFDPVLSKLFLQEVWPDLI